MRHSSYGVALDSGQQWRENWRQLQRSSSALVQPGGQSQVQDQEDIKRTSAINRPDVGEAGEMMYGSNTKDQLQRTEATTWRKQNASEDQQHKQDVDQ